MINQKDVIRLKVPYPSISDKLALENHMYICATVSENHYEYVKCQTLKPYMLCNPIMHHYCDEHADIRRNPFSHDTRIDCDKIFSSDNLAYQDGLKTYRRPDVCSDLFESIQYELEADGYKIISLNEDETALLNNPLVSVIP